MKTNKITIELLLISITLISPLFLQSCSTMHDVVKSQEQGTEGTTKTYTVTSDQAWNISKEVFRTEGADAIEEHHDKGYMLTSSGPNLVSWGAVMGAWIKPIDKNHTQVTVVTKRRISINIATTLTETTFHKRFAQIAATLKTERVR